MEKIKDILMYHQDAPLLFTQLYFWGFFLFVLVVFSFIYKNKFGRSLFLLVSSLFFYWKTGGPFFVLLLVTTLVDFNIGKAIHKSSSKKQVKWLVAGSLVVNLGILSYFKYAYFFTDIFNSAFNTEYNVVNIFARWANLATGSNFNISKIILPVGISFYTFQSLSYVIDLSKKKIEPVKNLIDYGFFVTFFPQLVAGPIVRASNFIPQIYKDFKLSRADFNHAIFLILNGLLKKMVISDYISINFVDRVFESPLSYTGFENMMAVFGFGIQIYCDFSGYTDIAIGIALLLGFRIPINFNSPYKARNISDFWQRWHISLTSWFRDYLFMPIAFAISKRLKQQKYGFLKADYIIYFWAALITFLLTGLWHGAAWRFVLWGGIHGAWIVLHRFWITHIRKKKKKRSALNHFFSVLLTFLILNFTWIYFRAPDNTFANQMIHQIFNDFKFSLIPEIVKSYWNIFALILLAYIIHWLPKNFKLTYENWFAKTPIWGKAIIVVLTVFICYQAVSSELQPFFYFQF